MREDIRNWLEAHRAHRNRSRFEDGESLLEAGVLDSMSMVDLITHLEAKYGITISEDDLTPENFGSVTAIVAYVAARRAESPNSKAC